MGGLEKKGSKMSQKYGKKWVHYYSIYDTISLCTHFYIFHEKNVYSIVIRLVRVKYKYFITKTKDICEKVSQKCEKVSQKCEKS